MSTIDFDAKVAFGQVVEVRQVRSRAVTQIIIEVDSHAHVAVTNLLFDKTALVIPFFSEEELKSKNIQAPYGVTTLSQFMAKDTPGKTPPRPLHADREASAPRPAGVSSMLGGRVDPDQPKMPANYAANAAILCEEPNFWRFLAVKTARDVTSEDQAIHALRASLDIESRSVLNKDPEAATRFVQLRNEYERSLA